MERCPNCSARWDGGEQCRRCSLELAPLLAVEQAADHFIRCALDRLAEGDAEAARAALNRASALHHQPLVELLSGVARAIAAIGPFATCERILPPPQGLGMPVTPPHTGVGQRPVDAPLFSRGNSPLGK